MAGRVSELSFFITEEQSSYDLVQQRIRNYEEMFAKLRVRAVVLLAN